MKRKRCCSNDDKCIGELVWGKERRKGKELMKFLSPTKAKQASVFVTDACFEMVYTTLPRFFKQHF